MHPPPPSLDHVPLQISLLILFKRVGRKIGKYEIRRETVSVLDPSHVRLWRPHSDLK